MAEKLKRSYCH